MIAFRLCSRARATLDGGGGLVTDGRWHFKGVRICYASSSISLAVLEVRVHRDAAPADFVAMSIDLPEKLILDVGSLPPGWHSDRKLTQDLGDEWLKGKLSVALRVPSVIVLSECNYLINPVHPAFSRIQVTSVTEFAFDARLFNG